jgi:hypothetical protein
MLHSTDVAAEVRRSLLGCVVDDPLRAKLLRRLALGGLMSYDLAPLSFSSRTHHSPYSLRGAS